jgi:hypothetical protein
VNRSAIVSAAVATFALALASSAGSPSPQGACRRAPERLADTGLYSDPESKTVAPGNLLYVPQYPLWSDGATKRRWIRIPDGAAIDASDPDAWKFPAGTKLWKEFSFGRRVETRYMERAADGRWIYATYRWSEDEREARLAPERGVRGACEIARGVRHDLPSVTDCRACHTGSPVEGLGFTALQLSPDRDPLAPHAEAPGPDACDLRRLAEQGLLRGFPENLLAHPPRIAAPSARARAALGYLQANRGYCHNGAGPLASLALQLDVPVGSAGSSVPPAYTSAVGVPSRYRPPSRGPCARIEPGAPEASALAIRMSSRNPLVQMPPLGTHMIDEEALALVAAWIREDLAPRTAGGAIATQARATVSFTKEIRQ